MKKLFFIFLLPFSLQAQPGKDGRQLVALTINYEPDQLEASNKYYLIADKPKCVTIKPNQTFVLQSAWHSEGDSVVNTGAGTLQIMRKNEVELVATLKPDKLVQKGDVAMFLVPLKKPGKDSLFFKMARFAIGFTTLNDSFFYDRNKMLETPAFYPAKKLAQAMANDIHFTADEMINQNNNQDQTIKSGKFKGQQLFAMMQKATAADVLLFMKYVYARPQKYMAHNWKVSETFATWVINGTQ
jgi:hypothetical protein